MGRCRNLRGAYRSSRTRRENARLDKNKWKNAARRNTKDQIENAVGKRKVNRCLYFACQGDDPRGAVPVSEAVYFDKLRRLLGRVAIRPQYKSKGQQRPHQDGKRT